MNCSKSFILTLVCLGMIAGALYEDLCSSPDGKRMQELIVQLISEPIVAENEVNVFVEVRDGEGNPVNTLTAENFSVSSPDPPKNKFSWKWSNKKNLEEYLPESMFHSKPLTVNKVIPMSTDCRVQMDVIFGFVGRQYHYTKRARKGLMNEMIDELKKFPEGTCVGIHSLQEYANDMGKDRVSSNRLGDFITEEAKDAVLKNVVSTQSDFEEALLASLSSASEINENVPRVLFFVLEATDRGLKNISEDIKEKILANRTIVYLWVVSKKKSQLEDLAQIVDLCEKSGGRAVVLPHNRIPRDMLESMRTVSYEQSSNVYSVDFCKSRFIPDRRSETFLLTVSMDDSNKVTVPVETEFSESWMNETNGFLMNEVITDLSKVSSGKLHMIMNALGDYYPMESLETIFPIVHNRAKGLIAQGKVKEGLQILNRLEPLLTTGSWRERFLEDYLSLTEMEYRAKNYHSTIKYAIKANNYRQTERAHGILLELYLDMYDFKNASRSAEWLYASENLNKTEAQKLMNQMITIYASNMEFDKALKLTLQNQPMISAGDPHRNVPILFEKAKIMNTCNHLCARALKEGNTSQEEVLDRIEENMSALGDLRWLAIVDRQGRVHHHRGTVATGETLDGFQEGYNWQKLLGADLPLFAYNVGKMNVTGVFLHPLSNSEVLISCFDAGIDKKTMGPYEIFQNHPTDIEAWSKLQAALEEPRLEAAVKILGTAFKSISPPSDESKDVLLSLLDVFPGQRLSYIIVTFRPEISDSLEILFTKPAQLPEELIDNPEANRHPYFLVRDREFNGDTLTEYTVALYRGYDWVGVTRLGIKTR